MPPAGPQPKPPNPTGPSRLPVLNDTGLRIIQLSGSGTNGLDIDSQTGLVYAVNNGSVADAMWCGKTPVSKPGRDTLSIVDSFSGVETAAIPTDGAPVWPWVSVANDEVYVAASRTGTVVVHSRGTGERLDSINVGGLPHDLALDPGSGRLIVSNTNDGSQEFLSVVDITTRSLVAHRRVVKFPHKIAVDFEAGVAYVVSVESGMVSVVDTTDGQVIGTFATSSSGRRGQRSGHDRFLPVYWPAVRG